MTYMINKGYSSGQHHYQSLSQHVNHLKRLHFYFTSLACFVQIPSDFPKYEHYNMYDDQCCTQSFIHAKLVLFSD